MITDGQNHAGGARGSLCCDPWPSRRKIRSRRRWGILARLKSDWPEGEEESVCTIKPSDCDIWTARQAKCVGRSHYKAYVQLLKDVLKFAVLDRIIAENPAAHLKYLKRETPIRHKPCIAEFRAIVDQISHQRFSDTAEQAPISSSSSGLQDLDRRKRRSLNWADVDFERGSLLIGR